MAYHKTKRHLKKKAGKRRRSSEMAHMMPGMPKHKVMKMMM